MPKNPISQVVRFDAPDKLLAELEKATQGTLLSAEEVETLSPEGRKEYFQYEKWVYSAKRVNR